MEIPGSGRLTRYSAGLYFLPMLEAANQAQIVNIASVAGLIGVPAQTAYTASKFAIRGFSEHGGCDDRQS